MNRSRKQGSIGRIVLVVSLALLATVLAVAAVVVVPILTHQSAGGSGNEVPEGFVSEVTATGDDGRERVLAVETPAGEEAELSAVRTGEIFIVSGSGFDPAIGVYVSVCKVPETPGQKPSPCLGGLPEGAMEGELAGGEIAASSAWVTSDWAWRSFATKPYDDSETGSFEVALLMPPAAQEGLDCTVERCAITVRADHTASSDRVQDMQLPVAFDE